MRFLLATFTYKPIQRWGPISPHGLGTAVGFFIGAFLMARRAEPRGIPRNEVYNAVTWGAGGAIIGARGFYVLGHIDEFRTVGDMLAVWQGGLTMFGGFIGGLALGLAYLRRRGYNIADALEAAAPGFVAGVICGRVGDIVIADHLGRRTNFLFGYRIPSGVKLAPGYGPPTYVPGAVVHHTAIYDLLGALLLLGFLYLLQRRRPATGTLFATFSIWYGLQRFVIDFTRNRETIESVFFGLSGSQWAGLGFALAGAFALYRVSRRAPPAPVPTAVPFVPEPILGVTTPAPPGTTDAPPAWPPPPPAAASPVPVTPVPAEESTPPPPVAEPAPSSSGDNPPPDEPGAASAGPGTAPAEPEPDEPEATQPPPSS